ncbi:MAG: hypothetical protein EA417_02170 [Gammaproteobacteria bacterium]|nr:MAG: hypothetical protein EA417_02170 [Gammaproteobacteria bacterium]
MMEPTHGVLDSISRLWDEHVALIVAAKSLPMITSTGKALALIFAAVVAVFSAGGGFALWWTTNQGLPSRLGDVEERIDAMQRDMVVVQQDACVLRVFVTGEGDLLRCYREGGHE